MEVDTLSDAYMVSDQGKIWSRSRWLTDKNGKRRYWKGRYLAAERMDSGYWCIVLDRRNYWVHRLVAKAFIPNPENKPCVNHKDGNKSNNAVGNLEWVTHRENMVHALRNGYCDGIIGSNQHNAKLNESRVAELLVLLTEGKYTDMELSRQFGVCRQLVTMVKIGVIWKHVPRPEGMHKQWEPIGLSLLSEFPGYGVDRDRNVWSKKWGVWKKRRVDSNGYIVLRHNGVRYKVKASSL